MIALLVLCLVVGRSVHGLNLPGVAPRSFEVNEGVTLKANKVTSMKTPVQYDYYGKPGHTILSDLVLYRYR